jgi:hypothetical protein
MMAADRPVQLSSGLRHGGVRYDRAAVRPMTGADEVLWAEAEPLPAMQATALLAAVVRAIGPLAPLTQDHVRSLTIGDRERLLLALYGISFGSRPDALVQCLGCGETIELSLNLDAVIEAPVAATGHTEHTTADGLPTLRFRVPNGADHERAARLAATDPERAAATLRDACVIAVDGGAALESELDARLAEALRGLDPGIETTIAANCPNCDAALNATLDAPSLIAARIGPPGGVLVDVDRLARAYHWSEAAILELPTARRHRYLALLDRAEAG